LVQRGGKQVNAIGPADAELIGRVELDISGPGAGSRVVGAGGGQFVLRLRVGADPDVAEARVALGPARAAERFAAVGHDADVDVRLARPGGERPQDLALPGRGRGDRVQGTEALAGARADRRVVRGEAECQVGRIGPRISPGSGDATVLELLDKQQSSKGWHGKILIPRVGRRVFKESSRKARGLLSRAGAGKEPGDGASPLRSGRGDSGRFALPKEGTLFGFPKRIAYFFEGGKNFSDFSNFFCLAITQPSCLAIGRNGRISSRQGERPWPGPFTESTYP